MSCQNTDKRDFCSNTNSGSGNRHSVSRRSSSSSSSDGKDVEQWHYELSKPRYLACCPKPLFAYGTLCAEPFLAWAITGDADAVDDVAHMMTPARVHRFVRSKLFSSIYPAAIRNGLAQIDGFLIQCDTLAQRAQLDALRGKRYTTISTWAHGLFWDNQETGDIWPADLFLYTGPEIDVATGEAWHLRDFVEEGKKKELQPELLSAMVIIGT